MQTDKNFNVNRLNAPVGFLIVPGVAPEPPTWALMPRPADTGMKPQSIHEFSSVPSMKSAATSRSERAVPTVQ